MTAVPPEPTDDPAPLVRYAADQGVASVTLDSQGNRNALSRRLLDQLLGSLDRAEADARVRVVVLGAAGRTFCSGADLSEAVTGGMEGTARTLVEVQRRIVASPKPVVARVQGAVRAGGLGLVAAADVAVASRSSSFALTEVRLGLAPATISLTVLPRMTSRAAAWAFLTGEVFDGTAAEAMGLVSTAVPEEELDTEVGHVVGALTTAHPQGLRETKRLLTADVRERIDRDGERLAALSAGLFGSPEGQAALQAFLDRGDASGRRSDR